MSKQKRYGDWFYTYTGKRFYPLDPRPEDVCLEDIAHHLSNLCRFNGAVKLFYSVAQHSVLMAEQCPEELKLVALMHDATEAYVGDMIRPLKKTLLEYQDIERMVWMLGIAPHFDLPVKIPPEIKEVDTRMLVTERRDLLSKFRREWSIELAEPYDIKITPISPAQAEECFLAAFKEYRK